jgi:predicted nucleic acid-binding protein
VKFLLDTNVVSEWVKPQPNRGLVTWLTAVDEDELCLSIVTVAELRRGAERLPNGRRRRAIEEWIARDVLLRFERRLLGLDVAVAEAWGTITAQCEARGRPISAMDAFVAAVAECHGLSLVTRNEGDFAGVVRSVINPWSN